jgi:4-amino-4-deoxy-L-arabinose transferase-like glycosyltransferase
MNAAVSSPSKAFGTRPFPSVVSAAHTNRFRFAYLFLALAVFLSFALGQRGLSEPDEGRYANMALEMLESNSSLWEPESSDFHHYDKPPLIYWTTAASFRCFGKNELAARMPSLFGAMLSLAGLCWAAWRLYGREVAWWSVLICGTLGQFWVLARFLSPDMLLTGWCAMAIAAWAEARHRNTHLGFWFLSLFFWILAWWTKATPALVPLLGLTSAIFLTKDVVGKNALRPGRMFLGILVLGSPWYLLMMTRHPDLARFFFGHELFGRIVGNEHGRHKPFYFFFLTSWFLWFPWLPILALLAFFKRGHFPKPTWRTIRGRLRWDGWIVLMGLLIFSLNSSKLLTYTLPLAPWMALFSARILVRAKTFLSLPDFRRIAFGSPVVFAVLAIVTAIAWPSFESRLGINSSVREVARYLQTKNARVVFMDKYWPGMEFYFGENVYYADRKMPRELVGDTGFCADIGDSHFCKPEILFQKIQKFPDTGVWLVRYLPHKTSAFARVNAQLSMRERKTVGNFELMRIN